MDQIAKFLCLNISTFICPSAGIKKSVKNKIRILVSRGQTFFFAPKYPHFSLKITKTVFSQNFPKVWFNGQCMWDHTHMDDHYQLSNLLIRKISCGRYARGAWAACTTHFITAGEEINWLPPFHQIDMNLWTLLARLMSLLRNSSSIILSRFQYYAFLLTKYMLFKKSWRRIICA